MREAGGEERLIVRPAEPDDFDRWLPLWEGYNAFYGREGAAALGAATTADRWSAFHSADLPMWALVACHGDQMVGLAHYVFHLSTTSLAPSCYMQDLFTRRDHRGLGVARALIEGVASLAQAAGCASVYWQTRHANEVAMQLYERVATRSEFVIYRRQLT